MKNVKIVVFVAIVAVLVGAATLATVSVSASVFAKSSSTNFGQCQKAQIERFATHDFAQDFCKVP